MNEKAEEIIQVGLLYFCGAWSDNWLVTWSLGYAFGAHHKQFRKNSDIPYIVHPLQVAKFLSYDTQDPVMMSAALLHDTVEDCGANVDNFPNKELQSLVKLLTNEGECKRSSIKKIRDSTKALHIKMADRLANLTDDLTDYHETYLNKDSVRESTGDLLGYSTGTQLRETKVFTDLFNYTKEIWK